jgi:hypothetical protein
MVMNAISSATAGMATATNQLNQIASRQAFGSDDPVQDAVGEITASTDFKANVAVLKTADQMAGALLDLKV